MLYYGLDDDNNVIEMTDKEAWYELLANYEKRTIGKTMVGHVEVSTMFLGRDYGYKSFLSDDGPPLCFETHVFGGKNDGYETRYSTWAEAKENHDSIVICLMKDGSLWRGE